MRAAIGGWAAALSLTFSLTLAGYAYGAGASTAPPTTPPPKPVAPTWVIVEVKSPKGDITYEVMQPSAIKARVARVNLDYKTALDAWKHAKQLAEARKTFFTEKQPTLGYARRVETSPPSFKYQDVAAAAAAELTKKMKERKAAETP